MKRNVKNAESEVPAAKRRQSNTNPPAKTPAKDHSRKSSNMTQSKPLISNKAQTDQAIPVTGQAIMKPLPLQTSPPGFPCFDSGSIYIIIDSEDHSYQYRLHKSTLEHLSTRFAKILAGPLRLEEDMALKIAKTSEGARRFELGYSREQKTWLLRQSPFTVSAVLAKARQSPQLIASLSLSNMSISKPSASNLMTKTSSALVGKAVAAGESNILGSGNQVDLTKLVPVDKKAGFMTAAEDHENAPSASHNGDTIQVQNSVATDAGQTIKSSDLLNDIPVAEQRAMLSHSDQNASFPSYIYDITIARQRAMLVQSERDTPIPSFLYDSTVARQRNLCAMSRESSVNKILANLVDEENPPELIDAGDSLGPLIAAVAKEREANAKVNLVHDAAPIQQTGEPANPNKAPVEICEAYNNLFLMFYKESPILSTSSLEIALKQCELLIDIATRLGSLPVIRTYLGNHLGQFGLALYYDISRQPIRWLFVSLKLESAPIFREAMVHLVGRNMPPPKDERIPDQLMVLFDLKVSTLAWLWAEVNQKLLISCIVIRDQPVRLSITSNGERNSWFAQQLFRDFCCNQIRECFDEEDCSNFYRRLAAGGNSYLPPDLVYNALVNVLGRENVDYDELEADLNMLKDFAKTTIAELMVNESMLGPGEGGIDYFTCTHIVDSDLPWAVPDDALV